VFGAVDRRKFWNSKKGFDEAKNFTFEDENELDIDLNNVYRIQIILSVRHLWWVA